jgi:hypothetical protein
MKIKGATALAVTGCSTQVIEGNPAEAQATL